MSELYAHIPLNQEIQAISGHFSLEKECRIEFLGQELFYVVGSGFVDTSCCGMGGCCYALVPGFVVLWKTEKNKDGLMVSKMEPITDPKLQKEITSLIKQQEVVTQVNFL